MQRLWMPSKSVWPVTLEECRSWKDDPDVEGETATRRRRVGTTGEEKNHKITKSEQVSSLLDIHALSIESFIFRLRSAHLEKDSRSKITIHPTPLSFAVGQVSKPPNRH